MTDENDALQELADSQDSEVAFAFYVGAALGLLLGAGTVLLANWLL